MNRILYSLFCFIILIFAGCASNPSISSLSPQERVKVSEIIFLSNENMPKSAYNVIGTVEGLSCKRNLYASEAPTFEEAQQGVRIRAAQLGADAAINMLCERNLKIDWIRNCWESVICVADAIKITDKTILSKSKEPKKSSKRITTSGTAWVVGSNLIVTNNHVINDASQITAYFPNGGAVELKIVATDPINDLALLSPKDSEELLTDTLPIASSEARVGESVFTIGYPHIGIMGKNAKMTSGVISSRSGINDDPRIYQTTVPLQPGNSGGPLLNMKGEVVGVTTSKLDAVKVFNLTGNLPEGVNFAIKSHYVFALIASATDSDNFELNNKKLENHINLEEAVEAVNKSVILLEVIQ